MNKSGTSDKSDKSDKIRTETRTITPEVAAAMLENNLWNRNLRRRQVTRYATDMREGRWIDNGEPFRVVLRADGTELLRDGQHRLTAAILADYTFADHPVFIMDESHPDAERLYASIDGGATRTIGDVVRAEYGDRISGVAPTDITQGIRAWLVINRIIGGKESEYENPSNEERLEILRENAEDITYAAIIRSEYHKRTRASLPAGVLAALMAIRWVDQVNGAEFAHEIITGEMLEDGDPAMTLREQIVRGPNAHVSKRSSGNVQKWWYVATVRAWNARCANKKLWMIQEGKYMPDIDSPERSTTGDLSERLPLREMAAV